MSPESLESDRKLIRRIAELEQRVADQAERIAEMAALLDRVAHTKTDYPYGHPLFARQRCLPDCPACAWSKLKEGK